VGGQENLYNKATMLTHEVRPVSTIKLTSVRILLYASQDCNLEPLPKTCSISRAGLLRFVPLSAHDNCISETFE
jgi:hypothetical protein